MSEEPARYGEPTAEDGPGWLVFRGAFGGEPVHVRSDAIVVLTPEGGAVAVFAGTGAFHVAGTEGRVEAVIETIREWLRDGAKRGIDLVFEPPRDQAGG